MSTINELSYYPGGIDSLLFFQDNGIEHADELKYYKNLISENKYTEASSYADFQSNLHMYSGSLFNCIENRILELQKYLLTKNSHQIIVSADQPEDAALNTIWINDS